MIRHLLVALGLLVALTGCSPFHYIPPAPPGWNACSWGYCCHAVCAA